MKIKLKPMTFGPIFIHVDQDGNLRDDVDNPAIDRDNLCATSPAVLQLFALGSCIAISLAIAAKQMNIMLNAFDVEVTSRKSEDLPGRFGSFQVKVSQNIIDDKKVHEELLSKAKSICTVSNTLNAEIVLSTF